MGSLIIGVVALAFCALIGLVLAYSWLYALALTLVIIFATVILIHYKYGLYLTAFLLPFVFAFQVSGLKVALYEVAFIITFVSFLTRLLLHKERLSVNIPYRLLIGAQVLLVALNAAFISVDATKSFFYCLHFFEAVLLFWMTFHLTQTDRKATSKIVLFILASAVIQASIGIYQHFTGQLGASFVSYRGYLGVLGLGSGRVTHAVGTLGTFNVLGAFLGACLFLTLPMILDRRAPRHRLKVLIFALLATAFIFTYSRGALLGLATGVLVVGYRRLPKKLYIVLILIGALFAGQFIAKAIHGRYIETVDYQGRKDIWVRVTDSINESPKSFYFGTGSNTFERVIQYPAWVVAQDRKLWFAHNQYLLLWQEFGLIGLLIFLALFAAVLARNARYLRLLGPKQRSGLRLSMVGITLLMIVHGYFDHQFTLTHSRNLYFIILALSEAA